MDKIQKNDVDIKFVDTDLDISSILNGIPESDDHAAFYIRGQSCGSAASQAIGTSERLANVLLGAMIRNSKIADFTSMAVITYLTMNEKAMREFIFTLNHNFIDKKQING